MAAAFNMHRLRKYPSRRIKVALITLFIDISGIRLSSIDMSE